MAWFNVKVKLVQESVFSIDLEATDSSYAEQIVQDAVWNDEYAKDIRATLEITDEQYEADEWCMECDRPIDYCVCEEDDDESE